MAVSAYEFEGFQANEGVVVPFHLNFREGITMPEALAIQQRLAEDNTASPEVEPVLGSAEVISLDALAKRSEREAAA